MSEKQIVIIELAGVNYGIDMLQVHEIMRMVEITPVASTDFAVEGIINLRDEVITVINTRRFLGLPAGEINQDTRIIVIEQDGKKTGLVVDRVSEVGTYNSEETEDGLTIIKNGSFLQGIVKRENQLWLVLNLNKIA